MSFFNLLRGRGGYIAALLFSVAVNVESVFAQAASATPLPQQNPAQFVTNTVWFFLTAFFVYWFLVLRPQMAKEDEHKAFIDALNKNDEVVTGGGIFGRVVSTNAEFVTVEVAPNVRLKVRPDSVNPVKKVAVEEKSPATK